MGNICNCMQSKKQQEFNEASNNKIVEMPVADQDDVISVKQIAGSLSQADFSE